MEASVTLTCSNFIDEGTTIQIFIEAKKFRLGEVAENQCKQVTELESKMMPSTPPEVLEEHKKETTDTMQNMEET